MDTLERNILNANPQDGHRWLKNLPALQVQACEKWQLSNPRIMPNLSWHYLFEAEHPALGQVVVKIGKDKSLLANEYAVLTSFDSASYFVRVFDCDLTLGALLLERVLPGDSLLSLPKAEAITQYGHVIKQLQTIAPSHPPVISHVSQWLLVLQSLPSEYFTPDEQALARQLVAQCESEPVQLCHGDLHCQNLLLSQNGYRAIDPKGVIASISFEASAFDVLCPDEMKSSNAKQLCKQRIEALATACSVAFAPLARSVYLRCMLSAQWFIQDGGNPHPMIKTMRWIQPLVV